MVNKVILVGNVGADPEVKYLDNGVSVARFSLATTETYKNKQGERVSNTEWHNITLWRGLAKVAEDYVKKGTPLYIEGKITYRTYEKDGETKYFTEIVANEMKLLGRRGDSDGSSEHSRSTSEAGSVNEPNIDMTPDDTDDLPF